MFDTRKGIYILTRGNEHEYLGLNVDDLRVMDIVDVETHPDLKEIRFLTSQGRMIIYNYLFKAWTEGADRNLNSLARVKGEMFYSGAVNVEGQIPGGTIYKEAQDKSYDYSTFETGWISFQAVQQYKRLKGIRFVGDFENLLRCRVAIGYDWDESLSDTGEKNIPNLADELGQKSLTAFGWKPERQKCSSIKIKAEFWTKDFKPFVFSQLSLEMAFSGSQHKIAESLVFEV